MKKEYTNPEMIITSYEADSEIMLNAVSAAQTNFSTKNYSEIQF
ncbi:MAG: hypothetical protein Q4D26_10145 [Clostridia bacterium]|nr:hypothetical protein [Clostridia bacterium]